MALFTSEYTFKVDRKGRVSVPADYRNALASQTFQGIVVIPAWDGQALDGYGHDRLEAIAASLDHPEFYGPEEVEQAQLLFAEARRLPFDGEGRILLPEECLSHAQITEQVVYAGLGPHFRLWNPAAYADYKARMREKVRSQGRMLRLKPLPPAGRGLEQG